MKSRVAAVLIFLTLLCGCAEEETTLAPEGAMIATINGEAWQSSAPTAIVANNTIYISGNGSDGTPLDFFVGGFDVGSYPVVGSLDGAVPINFVIKYGPTINDFSSSMMETTTVGKIEITAIDHQNHLISGIFESSLNSSFFCRDSILQVKSGSFTQIPYSMKMSSPGSPSSYATAKIDGDNFNSLYQSGHHSTNHLILEAVDEPHAIKLYLPKTVTPGTYALTQGYAESDLNAGYVVKTADFCGLYGLHDVCTGDIVITLHDVANKRIEGTFEITAQNTPGVPNSIVQLTDGNFAITYR